MSEALRGLEMATKWFNNGKELPRAALQKIVGYFHRVDRPLYMGYVSLEIGYSLDQTEAMLVALSDVGIVRQLSVDELKAMKVDVRANMWVLVEKASISKAGL